MSDAELDATIHAAAQWMARLQSGTCSAEEQREFMAWRAAEPRHAEVFERMAGRIGAINREPLHHIDSDRLLDIINTPSSRRRFVRGILGVATVGVVSAAAGRMATAGLAWPGDLYTGTGQRRVFGLSDGSELTLNACTRVTPHVEGGHRSVTLHGGELLLKVAAGQQRPFDVKTGTARVSAAAASSFILRAESDDDYQLTVLDHEVQLFAGNYAQRVHAGEVASVDAAGVRTIGPAQANAAAWIDGYLEVDDVPLGKVVGALRNYRHGLLRISPAAAQLRISGIFSLDDPEQTLRQFVRTLPIRLARYSDYWVSIDVA